jgi:hypothetical protein
MFNLNFDICLVPFHAILTEITVFKLKQTFLEPPRISWKGPIKTNWITFTIFLRLLFQLVGWFDEVSCSGSKLCWRKSHDTREYLQLIGTSLCAIQITLVLKHNLRELREAIVTSCRRKLKQQMIQNSIDCMISRARRCIRAGGHASTDEYGRLFLNHKRERTDNKV